MTSHKPNYVLIITVFALVVFGLIMMASASSVISYEKFGENYYYFRHQLIFGILFGLIAFIFTSRIDYHRWQKLAVPALLLTLALLVMVLIPGLGLEHGGAKRWIHIGSFTMQPTEIAKLTFLLYLATWFEKRGKGMKDWKYGFLPFVAILGVIGLLTMAQPDLGTFSIIVVTAVIVYFVAGASWTHLVAIGAGGAALFWLLVRIAPYRMARFIVFLNPEIDPQGIGYQINQALLAIGSGGFFGRGLGKSIQKFQYLPEAAGDSIFAIIAEELGFLRILLPIGLFILFAYLGFKIARQAPDNFGRLVACGITGWLCFQAFINIAAMANLIPLTGIPLPFVSYGGTALMVSLAAVGILVNISKYTNEKTSRYK